MMAGLMGRYSGKNAFALPPEPFGEPGGNEIRGNSDTLGRRCAGTHKTGIDLHRMGIATPLLLTLIGQDP
ncbi:hypothetical protein A7A09_006280 [Paracoccus methylarcula]|uniref:Uncharacterized protein n=1 Tax=Paracoccus methylarcula TaxID=72022 RepID=A0A422QZ03_9RHOB|nr:hypothetical protein A7A09_006280 [Paracoccus methylarcula]